MSLIQKLLKKSFTTKSPNEPSKSAIAQSASKALSLASEIPQAYLPIWNLHKQRQLLEIRFKGSTRAYQSMIIALDFEREIIWLDDLFPQQLLDIGDEIQVRHHRHGEHLTITGQVIALGETYGASGFALILPPNAAYVPRRAAQRFGVASKTPTMVRIRTLGQDPITGTLQDISRGGLRLNVPGNLLTHLRHGAQLPLCEFALGDDLHIQCRAKICAFRICRSPYRCTQISVEFTDLPAHKKQAIDQFLRESHLAAGASDFFAA